MSQVANIHGLAHEVSLLKNVVIPPLQQVCTYSQAVIGDYKYSARSNDHLGWLICNGRSLLRTEYPALFEVIGTAFGHTNTSNFYLPDFRGRVGGTVGQGSNLTNRALGASNGAETHRLSESEMPSHTHTGVTASNGVHFHTGVTASNGTHFHTGTTDGAGGVGSQGIAALGGGNEVGEDAGTHNHTFTTSTNGEHAHTFATNNEGQHAHTFTTDSTGGSQPHNNMQPTLFGGSQFIFAGTYPPTLIY